MHGLLGPLRRRRRTQPRARARPQRRAYLVRLQLLANGLDGVPALAEHRLKQPLLGLFALSLREAEGGAVSPPSPPSHPRTSAHPQSTSGATLCATEAFSGCHSLSRRKQEFSSTKRALEERLPPPATVSLCAITAPRPLPSGAPAAPGLLGIPGGASRTRPGRCYSPRATPEVSFPFLPEPMALNPAR